MCLVLAEACLAAVVQADAATIPMKRKRAAAEAVTGDHMSDMHTTWDSMQFVNVPVCECMRLLYKPAVIMRVAPDKPSQQSEAVTIST